MYKVSIPVLKRALKNQETELVSVSVQLVSQRLNTSLKRRKLSLEKSIRELKLTLGLEE